MKKILFLMGVVLAFACFAAASPVYVEQFGGYWTVPDDWGDAVINPANIMKSQKNIVLQAFDYSSSLRENFYGRHTGYRYNSLTSVLYKLNDFGFMLSYKYFDRLWSDSLPNVYYENDISAAFEYKIEKNYSVGVIAGIFYDPYVSNKVIDEVRFGLAGRLAVCEKTEIGIVLTTNLETENTERFNLNLFVLPEVNLTKTDMIRLKQKLTYTNEWLEQNDNHGLRIGSDTVVAWNHKMEKNSIMFELGNEYDYYQNNAFPRGYIRNDKYNDDISIYINYESNSFLDWLKLRFRLRPLSISMNGNYQSDQVGIISSSYTHLEFFSLQSAGICVTAVKDMDININCTGSNRTDSNSYTQLTGQNKQSSWGVDAYLSINADVVYRF